jgi:hypothetical protein
MLKIFRCKGKQFARSGGKPQEGAQSKRAFAPLRAKKKGRAADAAHPWLPIA